MGVWSSISFCNFEKRRTKNRHGFDSRNPNVKQILNIDSDSFSTTVLQDVQKIRIQESDFTNSVKPLPTDKKKESLKSDYPTYFEYSMGGNLKFYKEHLQQDFELEKKGSFIRNPRQQQRKTSHSDNDSEPESLRYSHKPQEKVVPVVNSIAEEPELSFDDYSSIYQPEFMLNINSQSLAKVIPKHSLDERVYDTKPADKRKKKEYKISSWSQDFIEDSSPENVLEHVEVHIFNKSKISPREKENDVLKKHDGDVFDYQSSSLKIQTNCEQLNNQEIISIQNKGNGNQEMKTVKSDKNSNAGTKKQTVSPKPRKPKVISSSLGYKDTQTKNTLAKESSSVQKQRFKDKSNDSAPSLRKLESKIEPKSEVKKPVERKEKSINYTQKKKFDNEKHAMRPVKKETLLPSFKNNEAKDKTNENALSRLSINTTMMLDKDDFVFDELSAVEKRSNEPKLIKDADFYPESPVSELSFFKTPCSTRHNSLETFEQLESECIKDSIEEEQERPQDNRATSNLFPNYKKLPKEFQEIARRLSKKDSQKKPAPSLHQINSSQILNCSSSTCSTISPRSPSGRTLFRTPSYKMPKTPSLSRQHPSTYVTQHTSSRSRSSSRVSSRATSPTREHIEALL